VTLSEAFANSLNDAAVRLSQQVGIGEVIAAARDLGLRAALKNTPSLALGTSEVTLLDLTSAYAAVRAGQAPVTPRGIAAIKTESGEVSTDSSNTTHSLGQVQSELIDLLRGVIEHGTGRAAALQGFAAGKTGTAQDYRDAWFIGFDDHLVVGVWVGNDDHSPMKNVTGGSLPAKIWKDFLEQAEPTATADVNTPASHAPAATVGQSTVGQSREPVVASGQERAAASDESLVPPPAETHGGQCNVAVCEQFYHSFRSSDCTYQPYWGGPRQFCAR
jgi:penicillin-binding protein 1A